MNDSERKTRPLTVVIKDIENQSVVLYRDVVPRRRFGSCVRDVSRIAEAVAENFFDEHSQAYAEASPKDFIIYFKSDECPPSSMTARLTVPGITVERGVMGSDEEPFEETFPYSIETSSPESVSDPGEFPDITYKFLGVSPPGVSPIAEFVRKMDERRRHE